ncbi:MAG: nucleotidyl transferase AbiEii/AbiGii toxin family protein, partial [Rubrivivax sp.]
GRLFQDLPQQLTPAHRDFLLSLVQGAPAWELMPMQHLRELPALKWKLMNLAKLKKSSAERFAAEHQLLAERFAQHAG